MTQIVKFGEDSIDSLATTLKKTNPRSIFFVTGKKSFIKCGAKNKLNPILKNYNYVRFFDFEENPKIEDVEKGVEIFKRNKCDFIISVGGGSVIDMGKLVNFFSKKTKPFVDFFNTKLSKKDKTTFVAIPTTAGAGSEATHFAVVYANKLKYSVADINLLPDIALIDHSFLRSQSKNQIVVSGLDAFCQGIESYWCVNSNEESLNYSENAISLSWFNLKKYLMGEDVFEKLAKAAYFAGKAINITKTTGPHALSYGFTTHYGIPHGHAVSLFLPYFMSFHKKISKNSVNDPRGHIFVSNKIKSIARILEVDFEKIEHEIIYFLSQLDININFKKNNIDYEGFLKTIKLVNHERLRNNPGLLNNKDMASIYDFNIDNEYINNKL